jgi:hypothetical protein
MSADAYRDDAPRTLREAQANEHNEVTWFPTGPAGNALAALLGPANTHPSQVDIPQH